MSFRFISIGVSNNILCFFGVITGCRYCCYLIKNTLLLNHSPYQRNTVFNSTCLDKTIPIKVARCWYFMSDDWADLRTIQIDTIGNINTFIWFQQQHTKKTKKRWPYGATRDGIESCEIAWCIDQAWKMRFKIIARHVVQTLLLFEARKKFVGISSELKKN